MAQDNGWLERLKPYLSGGEDESGATQTVTDGVPSWKQRLSAFMAEKEVQTSAPTESEALRNHASTDVTLRNRLRDAEAAEKQAGAAYREVMRSGDEQARLDAGRAVGAANAERRSAQAAYDASKEAAYIAQKNAQYASVRENSDFRTRSEPDANVMRLGQTGQDAAATLYWQINSRGKTKYKNQPSNYITDEEARTFNYLYNTRSEKDAMAYYDYIERDLNSRRETATLGKYQTLAEEKPAAANALSVGANLISGVGIADAGLQMLENRIQGDPRGVDYASGGMLPGKIASTIRETRAKNIAENHPFEIAGTNVASFLYQTGMSMADSVVVLGLSAIGAPAAVTLLGGSAATQAALEVKARGGGDGQALAYGIAAGINEMLFEKISLEALLKPAERGFAKGIRNVLKQAFTEGSEEVNTSVANALADYAISLYTKGGQTAIQNRAAQLRAQYQLSEADAMKASMNEWMGGLVTDFLGGFISGGVMGGAKVAGTNVVGATQDARIAALKTRIENAAQNPAPVQNAEPRTGAGQETVSPSVQNTQEQTEAPDVRDTGAAAESERTVMEAPETEEKAGEGVRNAAPAVSEDRLTNAERSAMISENAEGEMQNERTEAAEPAAAERSAAEPERGGQDTDRSAERGTGLADGGTVQTVSGAKRFLRNYVEQRNYRKQRSSARELSAAAETAGLRQVSAREMGVEYGTDTKQNAVLTRDLLTPAMRRRQAEFAARGIQVDYVIGLVETQETGKDAVQVRGAVSSDGKHIWVTANHPNLSWEKILDHEEFHTIKRQDAGIIDRTMQQMREDPKVSGHLDETLRRYEELYQPFGVEGDEVIEEMLADYYAGYDATRLLDTDKYMAKTVRKSVQELRRDVDRGSAVSAAGEADTGGQARTEADTGGQFSREVLELVAKVKNGTAKDGDSVDFGIISERNARRVYDAVGIDVSGYSVKLEARQIRHILKDHGENGETDHSMKNDADIARIPYEMDSAEEVRPGGRTKAYTTNENGYQKTAKTVLYEKNYGEKAYYVVEAVPNTKAKTIFIVSAFIGAEGYKKEAAYSADVAPGVTSKNASMKPTDTVPQNRNAVKTSGEKVNGKFSRDITRAETEAARQFGTTEDFAEAGFIIGDGRMLRFTDDRHSGAREYDHRAIARAYGEKVDLNKNHGFSEESVPYLDRFVEDGAIRIDTGDFDLGMDMGMQLSRSVPITKAQEDAIRDFVKWKNEQEESYQPNEFSLHNGSLTLRIEFGGDGSYAVGETRKQDLDAWNVPNLQYEGSYISPSRVIADIRHFYETGETREESTVTKFHDGRFSRDLDSRGEALTPQQAEYFRDSKVRDAQGRLKVMYHISDSGDIGVFQSGNSAGLIYFAETEKAARMGARGSKAAYRVYLNAVNPVNEKTTPVNWYDAEDSITVAEWKRNGYDGVYVKDESGVSFAVFSPEQIKRTDNENPTKDPDIRFSRNLPGETAELQDEYDRLREKLGYWKGQGNRTERFPLREEDTRRLTKSIEFQPEAVQPYTGGLSTERRSGASSEVPSGRKISRVRSNALNAFFNDVEANMDGMRREDYTYDPVSEKESIATAKQRIAEDFDGWAERLAEDDRQWDGRDVDTAMGILYNYRQDARMTGDYRKVISFSHVIQKHGTRGGQEIQAFAKYSRTATYQTQKAAEKLYNENKLNPAQQKRLNAYMEAIDSVIENDSGDAAKAVTDRIEAGAKSGDARRTDDALNVIREIYENVRVQRDHGEPVENWIELTGEKLAQELSGRMKPPKSRTKTTMQTILGDMIRFMNEHAVPKRSASENARTATARIADYINNRDAYAEVWATAQRYLRAQYADDPAALDALEAFLTGTISYNADAQHFDRTMYDAILETSDGIGLDVQKIRDLAAVGLSTQTVERIADEFVRNIRDLTGEDTDRQWEPMLRDAVTRHIRDVMMTQTEQEKRLGGIIDKTAKELNMKLGEILTQSKGDKRIAAAQLTNWLVSELGVRSSDAVIAAKTVTDAFMAELAERSDRRLRQMFSESGETQPGRKERNRLMELFRLGGFENQNVEDALVDALGIGNVSRAKQRQIVSWMASFADTLDSIYEGDTEALKALIREQAAIRNTKLSRTAEKVLEREQDFRYLYDFAMSQLKLIAGDFNVRSFGSKVSTVQTISHLLNIRTAMRNLISNQVYDLVASAANNVAILPDIALGRVTGSRTVGLDKSWASREKRLGAAQGARRNYLEISLDVNPKGDNTSKYGTKGRTTFAAANSRGLGRILNRKEKILGYELNTTDEFHKGSVRGETRDSLRRFVERGDLTRQEMEDFAESEALSRSFQDDTAIGNLFSLLKNSLNTIGFGDSGRQLGRVKVKDFGLGDMVLKYTQVPGALIHRAIEFSPIGYAKALYHIVQIRQVVNRGERATVPQRKAALAIGQATTGTGLILLFMALAKGGLLRRDDDEKDKNAKAAKNAQGLSGTQLNVSALIRAINGGEISVQDGDVLQDIGFLEPLDTLMTVATLLANEDELGLGDIPTDTLEGIWRALEDTSAMQTISSIVNVVQYHDEENDLPLYAEIPIEIASSNISGFVSAPIRQLAQATDTVYRDQYRSQKAALQIGAKLANSVPGARQILAPKITPLGRDKTYQKPALNALNALVTAGNVSVYRADKVVDELNRVYAATGDAKIWAERNAPYTVTVETGQGKEQLTLTPDERTAYQRSRGQLTERMISQTADAAWYKKLDAETQAEALNWIGNFANHIAKSEMLDGRGIDYSSRTYDKYAAMLGRKAYPEIVREAMSKSAGLIIAGVLTKDADRVSQMSSEDARSYLIDADMTDDEKLSAYGVLVGTEMITERGKPTQWARINTAVEDGVSVADAIQMVQDDTLDDYEKWRDSDAKKAGIESDIYIRYRTETAKLSADKGRDGKSISGSKKKKVVAYIHRLKLTAKQKDVLYLDAGYTVKDLGEAPWHRLSLPVA